MRSVRAAMAAICLVVAVTVAVAFGGPASAQGDRAGDFDYYVMALSWSPSFCDLEGRAEGREQCAPGRDVGAAALPARGQAALGEHRVDRVEVEIAEERLLGRRDEIAQAGMVPEGVWIRHACPLGCRAG